MKRSRHLPVAVTMGDPAGIGPEVVVKAAQVCPRIAVLGSAAIIAATAERLHLPPPRLVIDCPVAGVDPARIAMGTIQVDAGRLAAAAIEAAIAGALAGRYRAVATAPIHKQAIQLAGVPFPGHTEWFADRCAVSGETMIMIHQRMAVALASVHIALADVPTMVDSARLVASARHLATVLQRLLKRSPRLAILGLNPHAGEGGLFGEEDARVLPVVAALRNSGIAADGPLPPDTAFTPAARARYDGWLCWYHDQGLIPFKALCMDRGVNVTVGLPIVRTSVDHGTAFDIAGQNRADHRSMVAAIRLAERLSLAQS